MGVPGFSSKCHGGAGKVERSIVLLLRVDTRLAIILKFLTKSESLARQRKKLYTDTQGNVREPARKELIWNVSLFGQRYVEVKVISGQGVESTHLVKVQSIPERYPCADERKLRKKTYDEITSFWENHNCRIDSNKEV